MDNLAFEGSDETAIDPEPSPTDRQAVGLLSRENNGRGIGGGRPRTRDYGRFIATASISMRALRGSAATCTVERAGYGGVKCSA